MFLVLALATSLGAMLIDDTGNVGKFSTVSTVASVTSTNCDASSEALCYESLRYHIVSLATPMC